MTSPASTGSQPVTRTALIVFARAPVPGSAKTRLISALGADGAAALARRMLDHTVATALASELGPVTLCVTPDPCHPAFAAFATDARVRLDAQQGRGLGDRMRRALLRALHTVPRALLFGTDCPALSSMMLREAAARLDGHDLAFVPATDGGYVLVGASAAVADRVPQTFDGIDWGTDRVMVQTRARLEAAGLRSVELPALPDIDRPEDLRWVPSDWMPRSQGGRAPA